jgi:hypothetical protein
LTVGAVCWETVVPVMVKQGVATVVPLLIHERSQSPALNVSVLVPEPEGGETRVLVPIAVSVAGLLPDAAAPL